MSKRSKLWDVPLEQISSEKSFSSMLRKFGFRAEGGNTKTLKRILTERGIDFSHIKEGRGHNAGGTFGPRPRIETKDILVENSSYTNRTQIKNRLIRENLLAPSCGECGYFGKWNDKPLVFVLDHINGVYNDNRLENLRLLCPNCNSQQDTFAGRRKRYCRVDEW